MLNFVMVETEFYDLVENISQINIIERRLYYNKEQYSMKVTKPNASIISPVKQK